jgi:hypothetical protein
VKAWNLGNTTVRNPYRLKEGLRVLANSQLQGALVGKERESLFAQMLNDAEVVNVKRLQEEEGGDASDVGRKWRAAFSQLGFITPKLSRTLDDDGTDAKLRPFIGQIPEITGRPFEITPNGRRLLEAGTVAGEQEVFLRSLVAYQIPSPIEPHKSQQAFSPLRIVLSITSELEQQGHEGTISFEEMAYIVQLTRSDIDIGNQAQHIVEYRKGRAQAADKTKYDQQFADALGPHLEGQLLDTLDDYADLNIRYLKATGLFSARGRGITIAEQKSFTVSQLLVGWPTISSDEEYLERLWRGASLPTDHAPDAVQAIGQLVAALRKVGKVAQVPPLAGKSVADLNQIRHELEADLRHVQERAFADDQKQRWKEIAGYLRTLSTSQRRGVPRGEAPAYLEWALWRAFLAINSLANEPWEARRFSVDQDFLPIGTAPGRGPDMIFVFPDFVLVVEVTLTESSRQEAAEGEPVRRHVATIAERYASEGKRVYGLFIANAIDLNTTETLRIGSWYKSDNTRMSLRIVPLSLGEFATLFERSFASGQPLSYAQIERILLDCLADRTADAPQWKARISEAVQRAIAGLGPALAQ